VERALGRDAPVLAQPEHLLQVVGTLDALRKGLVRVDGYSRFMSSCRVSAFFAYQACCAALVRMPNFASSWAKYSCIHCGTTTPAGSNRYACSWCQGKKWNCQSIKVSGLPLACRRRAIWV